MNTQESKKLYNALLNKGYTTKDLGNEQVFLNNISDANKRRQLYDFVSSRGDFKIGDFNSYEKRLVGTQAPNPAKWVLNAVDSLKNQRASAAEQAPVEQNVQQAPVAQTADTATQSQTEQTAQAMPKMFRETIGKMRAAANNEPYVTEEEQKALNDEVRTHLMAGATDQQRRQMLEQQFLPEANEAFDKALAEQSGQFSPKQTEQLRKQFVNDYMNDADQAYKPLLDSVRQQEERMNSYRRQGMSIAEAQKTVEKEDQDRINAETQKRYDERDAQLAALSPEGRRAILGEEGAKAYDNYMAQKKGSGVYADDNPLADLQRRKELKDDVADEAIYKHVGDIDKRLEDVARQAISDPYEGEDPFTFALAHMGQQASTMHQSKQIRKMNEIASPENLWNAINKDGAFDKILNDEKLIKKGAEAAGMSVDDYMHYKFIPELSQRISNAYENKMHEKFDIKSFSDYLTRRALGSVMGSLFAGELTTKGQRQRMAEAIERAHEGLGSYKPGFGGRLAGEVAMFAPDAPILAITGGAGGVATKAVGETLKRVGLTNLGRIVSTGSPFLAANVGKGVKYGGLAFRNALHGAASMGTFMGSAGAIQDLSIGDGTWESVGRAFLEGMGEGAKFGAPMGVIGTVAGSLGSRIAGTGAKQAAKRAGLAAATFVAENQLFANMDRFNEEDFDWVESTADAFYMQMAGKLSSPHGIHGMKEGFKHLLTGSPASGLDWRSEQFRLTDGEREQIQKAFAGMDFEEIAENMGNIGKILNDKQNISWVARQKVAGSAGKMLEPNRPRTTDVSVRGKQLFERGENGELVEVHDFKDPEEAMQIRQQIEERILDGDMKSYLGILDGVPTVPTEEEIAAAKEQLTKEMQAKDPDFDPESLDKGHMNHTLLMDYVKDHRQSRADRLIAQFAAENGMEKQEFYDIIKKKPIERTDKEYDLIVKFTQRAHDTAYPKDALHPRQSVIDGENMAGNKPLSDPEIAAQLAQEVNQATSELNAFMQSHDKVRYDYERLANQDAPAAEIIRVIAENNSGTERDEAIRLIIQHENALAKRDGFLNKSQRNVDNYVAEEVDKNSLQGTVNGNPEDGNIITITNGQEELTLINANIVTDENGRINPDESTGVIIARDKEGNIVNPFTPSAEWTVSRRIPKDEYANTRRNELVAQEGVTLAQTGVVPPSQPVEEKKVKQPSEQAGGKAGATATGANEPPAAAPSEVAPQELQAEQPQQEAVAPERKAASIESVKDKDGIKRYENGISAEDAVGDMIASKDNPIEIADASIAEADEIINKINSKSTKTRKDLENRKEAQRVKDYYEDMKNRYVHEDRADGTSYTKIGDREILEKGGKVIYDTAGILAPVPPQDAMGRNESLKESKESLNVESAGNNEPENSVSLQPKAASERPKPKTVDEKRAERVRQLKEEYGEDFDDDFSKAQSAAELAAMYVGRNRTIDRDDLAKELGYKVGIGTEEPQFETLLAKKGEGASTWDVAHAAYESDENPIVDGEGTRKFSDKEIHDALIDEVFKGANKKSDIMDFVINSREEMAKRTREARIRKEEEAKERGEKPITLTDEEVEKIESQLPFTSQTDKEIPDAPITKLQKESERLMQEEGTPKIDVVDTDRMTDEDWRDLAEKAYEGAFIGDEVVEGVKKYYLEEGVFYDEKTGKITVFSGELTPEELRERVQTIKDFIHDRSNTEGRHEEKDMESERPTGNGEVQGQRETSEAAASQSGERGAGDSERDEYLKPRNDKEKQIVDDVEAQLKADIAAAQDEVNKAKGALEKAKAKESDRATDMFSDDNAFKQEGQLFDFEDMPTDRSQEGVNKRTQAEADALAAAQQKLDRLQSVEERNSRIRGALDNERRQTQIEGIAGEAEGTETKPQGVGEAAVVQPRTEQEKPAGTTAGEQGAGEEPWEKMGMLYEPSKEGKKALVGKEFENRSGRHTVKVTGYDEATDTVTWTDNGVERKGNPDFLRKDSWKEKESNSDPMAVLDEIKKEEGAKIGITHDETPQQQTDKSNEEKLNDTKLTTEEIRNANVSDVQKTLAEAYLNGNTGALQTAAYLNIYNNVRNRRQDREADSTNADGAQLVGGENQPEQRPGRAGGQPVEMAQTEGARQDEGRQLRVEDGQGQLHPASGEGGDRGVPGAEPAVGGVHTGGVEPVGGRQRGVDGPDVRGAAANERGTGNTRKPAAGSDAAIAASKKRLAELRQKFKDARRNGEASISFIGMNNEQIGILMDITTESANLGYQYISKGINLFNEWRKQMWEDFHDWLREDMKWSDAEIDEYINEVWNCEYNVDGVTRTISEWASYIGEKNLRNIVREDLNTKREKQIAAESIAVKNGDIDNIRETLPYLLPEQQEDVLKTETQFFDPTHQDREHGFGKGMMFTNGTGTGKTYTGLGIAKRFVKQGKGRVLIITPSQEKVSDWKKDGLNLGLSLESLDEDAKNLGTSATKAKGSGVVVTTYANARQNLKLLEDCFDLVIYDESHKITEGKDAAEGEMYKFHQMLTNKDVEKSIDRQTYYLPLWIEQRNLQKEYLENEAKLRELDNKQALTDEEAALEDRLNKRQLEVQKRLAEIPAEQQPIRESKRAQAEKDTKTTKTVFLSATPFNTRENLKYAEGYIFSFPEEDKSTIGSYNHRSPQDAFYEQYFPAGYRWRYGRLENHIENPEALGRQEIDFSDYLQNTLGTLSGRMITSEYDYSRDFPVLTLDHAGRFNQAMSEVYRNDKYSALAETFRKAFDYNYSTALFEAMKTSLVNERIQEHLNRGQKVVVFHRRRTSAELEPPFQRALDMARLRAQAEQDQNTKSRLLSAIAAFEHDFADMLEWEKTIDYTLPREQIENRFGKNNVAFFSGAETKGGKHKSIEEFMKDNGGKDIIVVQEASGKEGISLHDQTGEHQRVEINLALPQSPIAFIQQEGRIYRIGQKSNAIFEYPLLGLDLETSLFAQRFNGALGTTENLALGSKARNLRKSIANSVLENSGVVDYDRQGYGGKDMDGRVEEQNAKDNFDAAITDYYGNHKMQRGRDNREGVDYFPTPEPVGYKMVEWAQLMEGESALEPSAGHGAIARYVPERNALTAIEPSSSLFSKLQMRAGGPGRRFEEIPFEDYKLLNKHDAVLMNPPYGVGGKTAMEHVQKAFKHLNEGGRLIAIIPDGPAMQKRLDAWLDSKGTDGLNGAAVVVGDVKLPSVAFSRAGTSVNTRIVVIDKVSRPKMREGMPSKVTADLSGAKTVEELFETIRNVRMPERTVDKAAINQKRAQRTMKAFEDNKFVREATIDEDHILVRNRSTYGGVPNLLITFDDADKPAVRSSLFQTVEELRKAADNAETIEYGKWKTKTYGSGKNAVKGVDAIREYCDTAIKTIENVYKMTEDEMMRELKGIREEQERARQEQERQRELEMQQKIEGLKPIIDNALAENRDNTSLTTSDIERDIKRAHLGSYSVSEAAKRNLKRAGIDWQTGNRIVSSTERLEKAYNEEMPLDLDTMKNLMAIAETALGYERKMAAKRALEMSGIHSDSGEAKEGFDYSSHDQYYEKELRDLVKQASGPFAKLETKQQRKEREAAAQQQSAQTASKGSYEYKLDKNTRTDEDMHLVKMNDRLSDADYKSVERKAKALDGYYNRFKKAWHFKTEGDARKFIESVKGVGSENMQLEDRPTTRFRFAKDKNEFDKIREDAVKSKGLVVQGLADAEVAISHVERHDFGEKPIDNAREWANKNLVTSEEDIKNGNLPKMKDGTPYVISKKAIGKYLSEDGMASSDNQEVHLSVLKKLKDVISESIEAEVHPDYPKVDGVRTTEKYNDNALIHRLYGAVEIDGKVYRVKTTMQEFRGSEANKPHSYEVTKIELLDSPMTASENPSVNVGQRIADAKESTNNSISGAKLLNGVEKSYDSGKKLLDESEKSTFFRKRDSERTPREQYFEKKIKAGEKLAKKLNSDFEAITDISQVKNKEALEAIENGEEVPGWVEFDKDGKPKIFLYLPHVRDTYDAEKTIAHEVIGHKGLRELLGEKAYKSYMRSLLFDLKDPELSKFMEDNLARNNFDIYRTIDEYLAYAAEKGFGKLSMWQKVRNALTDALRSMGFTMAPSISDVKYMVWLSQNQLKKGEPLSEAKREALLYRLGKERYEAMTQNGEFTYDGKPKYGTYTAPGVPYYPGAGRTLFRHTPSTKYARLAYEKAINRMSYVWKEAHIDQMQAAVELMRAISGEKHIEDIPSAENFILEENQMSSKEEQMDFLFNRDYMKPLDEAVRAILPEYGSNTEEALRKLQLYMVKKHGLERNRVLYVRDAIRDLKKDPDADQNAVKTLEDGYNQLMDDLRDNISSGQITLREYFEQVDEFIRDNINPNYKADENDYSGLTSMAGTRKKYDDSAFIDDVMSEEDMIGEKRINDLWDKTNAVSQFGLDMEYEGGLDSKEKHDRVSKMFKWYVPLRGFDEKTAEEVYDYLEDGKKGNWAGPILMNAGGRESLSDIDVFAQLGAMDSYAIHRALQNQMKQTFARFIRNHYQKDGDNRLVTELKYQWAEQKYDPQTQTTHWEEVFPQIPEDAKADDVAQIVKDFEDDMKAKEANGQAKRIRQNTTIPYRPVKKENLSKHIVEVYINGEKKTFVVNGNPRAAQAINGQLKAEKAQNWASSLTNFMAKMNTSYSPDFIMRNTERDLIFTAANLAVKESIGYWKTWAKNYAVATGRGAFGVPAAHTNLFKRYRNGELNMNNETDRYFKEFMENGGETGWVETKNLDKWKKEILKGVDIKSTGKKAVNAVWNNSIGGIGKVIEAMNERAENLARFSTYMTSRQRGRSVARSVSDAKEVTVNFNRKGAGKKSSRFVGSTPYGDAGTWRRLNATLAGNTAQYMQNYLMFYNAGVQAVNNMAKTVGRHPVKGTMMLSAFLLAGMMPAINQFLSDELDEKQKAAYADLPEWVRRNNLCIYAGDGEYITIALPIELRAMYGIGDMAASFINRPELRSTKNAGEDILTQLSQVLPLDFMGEGSGPGWALVPSALKPLAEAALNTNWLGNKIERDDTYYKHKPTWMRAFKNVNDTYINLSKGLNALTNPYGDENIKGWADGWLTDPAKWQHVVEGYLGGAGSSVNRLANLVKHADEMSLGELVKSNWMPIVRTQHYGATDQTRYSRTKARWNYYKDEMEDAEATMKVLRNKGEYDPVAYMRSISESEGLKGERARIMKEAAKAVDRGYKALEATEDEVQRELIQQQINQYMQETVETLDAMR